MLAIENLVCHQSWHFIVWLYFRMLAYPKRVKEALQAFLLDPFGPIVIARTFCFKWSTKLVKIGVARHLSTQGLDESHRGRDSLTQQHLWGKHYAK